MKYDRLLEFFHEWKEWSLTSYLYIRTVDILYCSFTSCNISVPSYYGTKLIDSI